MNKQHQYPRLWFLLLLLLCVAAIQAQTYRLEYWFDGYSSPSNTPFSGSELNRSIDANSLDQGFHTVYMRVKSSDGTYSPVTSSVFFKFNVSGSSELQYWFDDNISKMATVPIDMTSFAFQVLNLDMTNVVNFPLGFHKLSMRVAAYGSNYSPIYSAYVMRLPEGRASQITYWLDDNYTKRSVVEGVPLDDKTVFIGKFLNLSAAPVGMHRLKYRVTRNGYDDGVIYEVPVMITKNYNNMDDVTIVNDSYWLDDGNPQVKSINYPGQVITKSYTLDPALFTVGQHAFHVQYKNSSNVWGEQNITYFYKEEAAGPLRAGFKPDIYTGIEGVAQDETFACFYESGMIYVNCQSPKLASNGIVQVFDLTGKLIASQAVNNNSGEIHAEINVEGLSKQVVVVRLRCGDVLLNRKIVIK